MTGECFPSAERFELDEEGEADDGPSELLHQLDRGPRGASGCQHVIHHQDTITGSERIHVQLEVILSVLQRVLSSDRRPGELAELPDGNEPATELERQWRGEDEAAGLDPDDPVDAAIAEELHEVIDHAPERTRLQEERRDVAEDDSRRGEVGHWVNEAREIVHR